MLFTLVWSVVGILEKVACTVRPARIAVTRVDVEFMLL